MSGNHSPERKILNAVHLLERKMEQNNWNLAEAWLAVAQLLMTCEVWRSGWKPLWNELVLKESNEYGLNADGKPNRALVEARRIGDYMAAKSQIPRKDLCGHFGGYIKSLNIQPNNPRGRAFRSMVAWILKEYGDPALRIEEGVDAYRVFPGHLFEITSREPRIDLVIYRGTSIVAMVSVRWTYRHDRLEMPKEAAAYLPVARESNPDCRYFGVTAELNPARLKGIAKHTQPIQRNAVPVMERLVHLHQPLATSVIGHNGDLECLMDLEEWVESSASWF